MAEYIDREKFLQRLVKEYPHQAPHGAIVAGMLCDEEPADVRPEAYGTWIADEYAYNRCSECGYEHDSPEYVTPYCPNCGARMEAKS